MYGSETYAENPYGGGLVLAPSPGSSGYQNIRSRFGSPPWQSPLNEDNQQWRKWLQEVWSSTNAMKLPTPTTTAPSSSPYVHQFQQAGRGRILVSSGTVSLIEWSRDGATFYPVGTSGGAFFVAQNDYIRVTYTVAPTVLEILD